jgi:hypothetical protein
MAKAVLTGKFIAMSNNIKKIIEIPNYLTMYLELLEKQEQAKPKLGGRKERVTFRAEINEMETKNIQRINETKVDSLKK